MGKSFEVSRSLEVGRGGPLRLGAAGFPAGAHGCGPGRNANKCSPALCFDVRRLTIMSSEQWKLD